MLGFLVFATALLGVGYAVFEKDTKRMLAFHTISQLGFILAAPVVAGILCSLLTVWLNLPCF